MPRILSEFSYQMLSQDASEMAKHRRVLSDPFEADVPFGRGQALRDPQGLAMMKMGQRLGEGESALILLHGAVEDQIRERESALCDAILHAPQI